MNTITGEHAAPQMKRRKRNVRRPIVPTLAPLVDFTAAHQEPMVSKNVIIEENLRTSMRLMPSQWKFLEALADEHRTTVDGVVTAIERLRGDVPRTMAVELYLSAWMSEKLKGQPCALLMSARKAA